MASISVFDVSWSDNSGNEQSSSSSVDTQTLVQNGGMQNASSDASSETTRSSSLATIGTSSQLGSVVRKDEMDSLVANEMNQLTSAEREAVYNDVHGITKPEEESQDEVDKAIADTRNEFASVRLKTAYNKALFLNPEYVNSNAFMLMFLRSCKFDPKQTAFKIVDHFKHKLSLFGYDNLGRDLMYEDLDDGTKNALSSGAVQILPQRDKAGRAIVFYAIDRLRYDTVDSQLRAIWYLMMCALSDPNVQRNGMVHVSYNLQHSNNNLHLDLLLKSALFSKTMPRKLRAVHFCYDNETVQPVLSMLQMIVGSSARLRFRSHFGSHIEVKYSLHNFGIPQDILPLDSNGKIDCARIQTFVQERKQADQERREELGSRIMHPRSKDVLMGRGWHQQEHPGNLELARIVDENREEYKAARKLHKTRLNWTIVETIRASGGRFLERSQPSDASGGVGWIEATDENARDKVSKCFRTTTKRSSKKSQEGNSVAEVPASSNAGANFISPSFELSSSLNSGIASNPIASLQMNASLLNGGIGNKVAAQFQIPPSLNSALVNNPIASLQMNQSLLNAGIGNNVTASLQIPSYLNSAYANNPMAALQLNPSFLNGGIGSNVAAAIQNPTVLNSASLQMPSNLNNPIASLHQINPSLLNGGIGNNVTAPFQMPSAMNSAIGNNSIAASLQMTSLLNGAPIPSNASTYFNQSSFTTRTTTNDTVQNKRPRLE